MENQSKTITFNRLPILGSSKITFDEWKFSFDHWCKTFKITDETEKIDHLFAITDKTARTIVYNSLNKSTPDNYDTIIKNLSKHYKKSSAKNSKILELYNSLNKSTPDNYDTIIKNLSKHYKKSSAKNSKILELSSITIRKDESITDFDLRFSELLNQVIKNVTIPDVIITSYYINAFRNWTKIYENLMEEEPTTLQDAMKITEKKEKILNLMKENKGKGSISKEKLSNTDTKKQNENHSNYYNKYNPNYTQNNRNNVDADKFNNFNYNNQSRSYYNNNNYNNRAYNNNYNNNNRDPLRNNFNKNKTNNDTNNIQKQKFSSNEIEEITKKLSDLKLNFC
eukprot:jgi/Orpsp1_1/1190919/evm.model.d7180000082134.1